jgi:hypothetical protein
MERVENTLRIQGARRTVSEDMKPTNQGQKQCAVVDHIDV